MQQQQDPRAIELLQKMHSASSDEERMQVLRETGTILPTLLMESPKHWAEDLAFVIDRLIDIDSENNILRDKLDIDRIGVFGMSLGGIAANEICLTDKRIRAGINMDGGLYGTLLEAKLHVPFMFLNSKRFLGYGTIFTGISTTDCYSLSVKDSDHYNFSDYSVYPMPSVSFLMGTIDGKKMIEIMNVMILAFFDKYIKNREDIDLIDYAERYPEIEIASNIEQQ
jgi:predicted dienelactone hydrolase